MNKNIFLCIYLITIFATVWLKALAIASPANSQLASNNFYFQENAEAIVNAFRQKPKDNIAKISLFAISIGVGTLCWKIYQSRQGTKSHFKLTKTSNNSDTVLLNRVSPKLRRQLLRLVNDPRTVNRLLIGIYQNNSHRSPDWIAEKAIYDLRRGR